MENLINIKCTDSTYLCNSYPNNNFYKEKNLLIGSIISNFQNYNLFKSLLRFHISDLNLDSAKNMYLYLFLENIHHANNNAAINISLSENDEDFNISNINWLTCPKKNNHTQINVNIPTKSIKKYIKIDISHIIKSLTSYTNIYNILIEPLNFNSSSAIQFSSINSENPPYLVLVNNSIDNKDFLYTFESSNNNDDNENTEKNQKYEKKDINDNDDSDIEDFSADIINELNAQNSRFDALEENLLNLINSFGTVITTIKSSSANIDNKLDNKLAPTINKFAENFSNINSSTDLLKDYIEKLITQKDLSADPLINLTSDLNELMKTEIYQLKNSINNDILELKSSNNKNISDLNNSIKNINETLLQLSNQIAKISKTIENVIIEPINDIDKQQES